MTKFQRSAIKAVLATSLLLFALIAFMMIKNTGELRQVLEDSVKAQLISISMAAREILDLDRFASYNSLEDVEKDAEAYYETLERLRTLQKRVGAKYIYALKRLGGKYYFIFDTDPEDEEIFIDYDLAPVHEAAFAGRAAAGVMNVDDEYGSYNTGAVPIFKDGQIVGIISTDIDDRYMEKSAQMARRNALLLGLSLLAFLGITLSVVRVLLKKLAVMQEKLNRLANYDAVTGLPNRQYLMSYLAEIAPKASRDKAPFAMMFVDLDNFKQVNDGAGHDAGDEVLRKIADYLSRVNENSKSFRPAPGILNISARIGGDEFIQIVPGVGNEAEAGEVAQKILNDFQGVIHNRYIEKYKVGLSIGVALFPYHTDNFNVLIKYADLAMYHAKNSGKNQYRIYSDEMSQTQKT